jgi:hypothetical protein
LFSDADVTYICVYPITSHTEFFDIAERHVRYVSRTLGKKVVKLSADYDPTWSNPVAQAWVGAANARCEAFEYEYDVSIHRSPPYTHNLNHSERFMGRIAAMANQQMLYAHLSPRAFWWTAVFSAAMIHNLGPVESKTRPLLMRDTTPFEGMTGQRASVKHLIGPLGMLCWIKTMRASATSTHGTKPNQFKPISEPAIYLGPNSGSAGWAVLPLSSVGHGRPQTKVTFHLTPDYDLSRRPALLAKHDMLIAESPLSAGPTLFNGAIRDLFRDNRDIANYQIAFSQLTGQPVALVPMIDPSTETPTFAPASEAAPEDQTDASEARGTGRQEASAKTEARRRRRRKKQEGEQDVGTHAELSPDKKQEDPTSKPKPVVKLGFQRLEHNARVRLRALPLDTAIEVEQENPHDKGSRVWARYEAYKKATTIGEYYALGARKNVDLPRDFSRNKLKIPTSAAAHLIDPVLALLANIEAEEIAKNFTGRSKADLENAFVLHSLNEADARNPAKSFEPYESHDGFSKEYIDYLNQAKLDQVEIQGKSSTRSPTDFKHKMDPSAAEFSPKGDNAADPGGGLPHANATARHSSITYELPFPSP